MAEIDNLSISISAEASRASASLNKLVGQLGTLSNSLSNISSKDFKTLAGGISQLGQATKNLGDMSNFTNLANSLSKLGNKNVASTSENLKTLENAVSNFVKNMNNIESLTFDTSRVSSLISSIAKLGAKNSAKALQNLQLVPSHLKSFVNQINDTNSINFNTSGLLNLTSAISKIGGKYVTQATANLPTMSSQLQNLVAEMNKIGSLSFDTSNLTNLVSAISKIGNKNITQAITNIPLLAAELKKLMQTLSSAPQVSRNLIDMTNALANLASQGSKVGSTSRSIIKGLNGYSESAKKAAKKTFSLSSAFGKFYSSYFWVIRGAKQLMESINSTADYFESFNFYSVAMRKIASEWDEDWDNYADQNAQTYANKFITTLNEDFKKMSGLQVNVETGVLKTTGMKNLGLSLNDITQQAAQLASVTNSLGQTGKVSLATASAFSKLGADMSSLFNVNYTSAMKNLQSGLIGQSRALYKYGIDITNATLQTYAYKEGLTKTVSEMTQAEKQQLRILAILDQSRVAWGDQANTINSLSNQMRIFKNNLSEISMVFGQLFVPIMEKIIPAINGFAIAFKNLLTDFAGMLGIEIDISSFNQGASQVEDDMYDVADSLDTATSSAEKYKNQLMGFDEINKLNDNDSSKTSTGSTSGGIDLTNSILAATDEYNKAFNAAYEAMENRAEKFAEHIEKAFEPIKKIIQEFAVGDFFSAGQDVSGLVVSITDFFAEAIDKVDWVQVGNNIGDFLEGLDWLKILGSVLELKFNIWKLIAETWFGVFEEAPIETALLTTLGIMNFTPIGNAMAKGIWGKVQTKLSMLAANKNILKTAAKYAIAVTVMFEAIDFAKDRLEPIFDEYDLEEIKTASQDMFDDWFGKNPLSTTLSDMFVLESYAIADPEGVIDDLKILWDDVCSGDFKFNLFNIMEFPSYNEMVDALSDMWTDIKNGDFKYNFLGLFELPSWNELKTALSDMWTDIKNGDFKYNFLGLFELPSWNELKTALSDMWTDIKNGDFRFSFLGLLEFPSLNELKNAFSQTWNDFKDWLTIDISLNFTKKIGSIFNIKGGGGHGFAAGGFPEDGWFRASHGEIMGKFDNGQSVVANNYQITNGIANAVYPAVYNAVIQAMGSSNNNNSIRVFIGDKELTDIVVDDINNTIMSTGVNPIMI